MLTSIQWRDHLGTLARVCLLLHRRSIFWRHRYQPRQHLVSYFIPHLVPRPNHSLCSAKASQIVFGGVTKGQGISGNPAMLVNLIAGSLSAGAAAQATDMVGDLKTGHLLRYARIFCPEAHN